MKDTGGYCLLDFIKKSITVLFAIDNIDFLEDTRYGKYTTPAMDSIQHPLWAVYNTLYGQYTLHGCRIVVNQEEDEKAETIN